MRKLWLRATRSARGELFNPLMWPFLFTTFMYGLAFTLVAPFTGVLGSSVLNRALLEYGQYVPFIWGVIAMVTIIGGVVFLLRDYPPVGRFSGIIGFMLWTFAALCYVSAGDFLILVAVAIPNMWFWFWQYLSLSRFRREDIQDAI